MKRLSFGAALVGFALVACQTAQTQSEPQVVVVPPGEIAGDPSPGKIPSAKPSTSPSVQPAAYASLPQSSPPTSASSPKYSYNSCNVNGPYIAMTFDDGPSPQLTPRLLDTLKERGIKATFFVVGQNAAEYPDILRRMASEGHEIANHSWSHPALTKLGVEGVRKQIENTNDVIAKVTGKRPTLMRPPYGATSSILNKRLTEDYGLKVILWSVDPLDWRYRNSNRVYSYIVQNTHPGAIILTHDIHATTVAAMPETLDTLTAKGYKFATVSELIAMEVPVQLVKKESPGPSTPAPQ
ncbi:MAG TPA: polysaccharide deacetylase family protein [Terrimicrobiaceae bacterium]